MSDNSDTADSDATAPSERPSPQGTNRRSLMRALGMGAGVVALGGTAAGGSPPNTGKGVRIDETFGAPYAADDTVPAGLVDHEVKVRGPPAPEKHDGFPLVPDDTFGEDEDDDPDEAPEFYFDPVGLHVTPGAVVNFPVPKAENHLHTVTAFDDKYELLPTRIPDDATAFTAPPVVGEEAWLYRFTEPGVYDISCLPHLRLGMVMRVVVFDPEDGDEPPADPYDPLEIPNAGTVFAASKMTPASIVKRGSVAWADLDLP